MEIFNIYPHLLLIFSLCAVSFLPRVLPAFFISKIKLTPFVTRFLNLIPYTAMTALVFPGIFTSIPGHTNIAYFGAFLAVLVAWFKVPLSVTVVLCVTAVVLCLMYL